MAVSRKVTFTLLAELADRLNREVRSLERSSFVAEAIADRMNARHAHLIASCDAVNADPWIEEIEREMDPLSADGLDPHAPGTKRPHLTQALPSARRGDVWWIALDPTIGSEIRKTRPCVVLTTNVAKERRRSLVVIPISSSPRAFPPFTVAVRSEEYAGVVVIDQIRAVSKERLRERLGTLAPAEIKAVEDALREILEP